LKIMTEQESKLSFLRKQESRRIKKYFIIDWIPASAGMTKG